MSIQALRERKTALAKEANHLLSENGAKVWSIEDKAKFDGIADQMEAVDKQIHTTQRLLDAQAEEQFKDVVADKPNKAVNQARLLLNKMLRDGPNAITMDEHKQIRNVLSTGTGSQGGFTVQTDVATEFVDNLKGYRGIRDVADNITTMEGRPLGYPTTDGTAETGEIVAENTTAAALDPVFGTVSLNTFKFGSKSIAVPIELLQDSSIDVVGLINKRMRDRIGRIQNTKFTIGSGTGEPNGLVTASTVGKVGIVGQTLTVIYDDLVDLIDSVDYAYGDQMTGFMMSQSMRKVVRKIKDSTGRPIWTPNYDAGIAGAYNDELLGYKVTLNNDMPVPAANAKSLAFGAFKNYIIRDALEITLFRFEDSAFMLKGQIGFVGWARAGGNLLDTAAVRLYQNSAT